MFTVPDQENPLDLLIAHTGTSLVQNKLAKNAEMDRMKKIERATSGLNENSSDIEWLKALNNIPRDDQQAFLKIHENVAKGKKAKLEDEKSRMTALEKGEADKKSLETISSAFGPTAAKVWEASPVGGRTELLKTMLDAKIRGDDVEKLLGGVNIRDGQSPEMVNAAAKSAVTGKFVYPKLDTFADLKPSERPHHRENLRKENVPLYNESVKRLHGLENESRYIDVLQDINQSGKLPEGLGRIIINPFTKQPYGIAELTGQVNADTQRWIKTINDFTTRAKDVYGSRVTNFDLQQFMARLPGLLNTPEGRQVILEQMKLTGRINALYDEALKDVYQHYGADKITVEQANQIAENKIGSEKQDLENQLLEIGRVSDELYDREVENEMNELPDPRSNKGKSIKDSSTGQILISDGVSWRPKNA